MLTSTLSKHQSLVDFDFVKTSTLTVDFEFIKFWLEKWSFHFLKMLTATLAYRSENELAIRKELESIYNEIYQLIASKQRDLQARVNKAKSQFAQAKTKIQTIKLIEDMTTAATVHDALEAENRRIDTEVQKLRNEIQSLEEDDPNYLA